MDKELIIHEKSAFDVPCSALYFSDIALVALLNRRRKWYLSALCMVGGGSSADHIGMRELFSALRKQTLIFISPMTHRQIWGIVMEKAADMLAVDKTPNIISTNGNVQYVSSAKKKGVALDLMPYLQEDAAFASNISPQILEALQEPDGALYTLPDAVEYIGYWYNASLFKQAGITDTGTPEGSVILPKDMGGILGCMRCVSGDLPADRRGANSAAGESNGVLFGGTAGRRVGEFFGLHAERNRYV